MLVLTRRVGQQIVLPGCGVTIDVVGVTKSHVRIGVEAPSDVQVFRSEILNRNHRQRESRPESGAEVTMQAAEGADESESPSIGRESPPDLARCLTKWIAHRTSGRIRQLSVKTAGNRTLIRGWATSYYARQLAQAAVEEVLGNWPSLPPHEFDYQIDIVDRTFVSRSGATLLFSSRVGNGQPG